MTLIAPPTEATSKSFIARHRFFILIFIITIIALTMTVISIVIYNLSGSAQLDLSRPGYRSVSSQVVREDKTGEFGTTGAVSRSVIEEFIDLFDENGDRAKSVDAFSGDPLNPETLEFSDVRASE